MTSMERMQAKTNVGISDKCKNIKMAKSRGKDWKRNNEWELSLQTTILERNKERKYGRMKSGRKYFKKKNVERKWIKIRKRERKFEIKINISMIKNKIQWKGNETLKSLKIRRKEREKLNKKSTGI